MQLMKHLPEVLLWQLNNVITQDCVRVARAGEIVLFHLMSLVFLLGFPIFFSPLSIIFLGKRSIFLVQVSSLLRRC